MPLSQRKSSLLLCRDLVEPACRALLFDTQLDETRAAALLDYFVTHPEHERCVRWLKVTAPTDVDPQRRSPLSASLPVFMAVCQRLDVLAISGPPTVVIPLAAKLGSSLGRLRTLALALGPWRDFETARPTDAYTSGLCEVLQQCVRLDELSITGHSAMWAADRACPIESLGRLRKLRLLDVGHALSTAIFDGAARRSAPLQRVIIDDASQPNEAYVSTSRGPDGRGLYQRIRDLTDPGFITLDWGAWCGLRSLSLCVGASQTWQMLEGAPLSLRYLCVRLDPRCLTDLLKSLWDRLLTPTWLPSLACLKLGIDSRQSNCAVDPTAWSMWVAGLKRLLGQRGQWASRPATLCSDSGVAWDADLSGDLLDRWDAQDGQRIMAAARAARRAIALAKQPNVVKRLGA